MLNPINRPSTSLFFSASLFQSHAKATVTSVRGRVTSSHLSSASLEKEPSSPGWFWYLTTSVLKNVWAQVSGHAGIMLNCGTPHRDKGCWQVDERNVCHYSHNDCFVLHVAIQSLHTVGGLTLEVLDNLFKKTVSIDQRLPSTLCTASGERHHTSSFLSCVIFTMSLALPNCVLRFWTISPICARNA